VLFLSSAPITAREIRGRDAGSLRGTQVTAGFSARSDFSGGALGASSLTRL